jgi:hypothetical protein
MASILEQCRERYEVVGECALVIGAHHVIAGDGGMQR